MTGPLCAWLNSNQLSLNTPIFNFVNLHPYPYQGISSQRCFTKNISQQCKTLCTVSLKQKTWKIWKNKSFNKCKIMWLTRKKLPLAVEYKIEGQLLESVNVYRDLGLSSASPLSWNQHVDKITTKADRC